MIDEVDKQIIQYLQGDLPVTACPFAVIAEKIGVSEAEFLERVELLREHRILRRFGATLRHQLAGFNANAMVAWRVPEERVDQAGRIMAAFKEVSHCYQRRVEGEWEYNLFAMIHGKNKKDCESVAKRIADKVGIDDYVLLVSLKEYKKTSPTYF
jgi:DNA-binding Lrp family transcriptional regulator